MLRQAAQSASSEPNVSQIACVQANLVQLDWLRDEVLDVAVCLFSSIGMIRGRAHRQQFLTHVRRSLKPNAPLILHVHNRLHSLFDPGGPAWLLKTRIRSWTTNDWEYGDRVYSYRGLPSMFLHIYSRRELVADLSAAGFTQWQILPINKTASDLLPASTRFQTFAPAVTLQSRGDEFQLAQAKRCCGVGCLAKMKLTTASIPSSRFELT